MIERFVFHNKARCYLFQPVSYPMTPGTGRHGWRPWWGRGGKGWKCGNFEEGSRGARGWHSKLGIFGILLQGCRFVPYTFSETKPLIRTYRSRGLALIQGQIYNPVVEIPNGDFSTTPKALCWDGFFATFICLDRSVPWSCCRYPPTTKELLERWELGALWSCFFKPRCL